MTRIYTAVHLNIPVEAVFDYVTTPGNWPRWHPSSLAVSGATDHSLEFGEQVTEDFLVAGRRGQVVWTVRERRPPAGEGRESRGALGHRRANCRPAARRRYYLHSDPERQRHLF